MQSTNLKLLKIGAAAICFIGVNAFAQDLCVNVLGPGGHSSGNYGNTSAAHAASRAILKIHAMVPDATVTDFKAGSTVNAIAADASFKVSLTGSPEKQAKDAKAVEEAVKSGCAEENAFRKVKEGELENGLRKDIRCSVE